MDHIKDSKAVDDDIHEKTKRMAAAQAFLDKVAGIESLSQLNGQVTSLGRGRLADVLSAVGIDSRGHRDVLMKRLKNHFRKNFHENNGLAVAQMDASINHSRPAGVATTNRCIFDFLCVVDFEATCDERRPTPPTFTPEIIEFPAILIDTRTCQTRFEFHRFCRPKLNAKLTEFCTTLTGITQDTVDRSPDFCQVLDEFRSFVTDHGMGKKHSWAIVTDSQYDMGHFMAHQCQVSGIPFPKFGKEWINIRKTFSNFYGCKRLSLIEMLDRLGMEFEGRQHSGLDDARNILRVTLTLIADGAQLKVNESVGSGGGGGRCNVGKTRHGRVCQRK